MVRALIADPDPTARAELDALFRSSGLDIEVVADGRTALQRALEDEIDLVIAELSLPELDGLALLQELQHQRPETAVILVTAFGSVEDAVHAMRAGACDFISKPYSAEQLQISIDRSLEKQVLVRENEALRAALDDRLRLDSFIAADTRMHEVLKTVRAVAPGRTTVLLTGESGTGKTLVARAVHKLSRRAAGPFVEVNCGALPESLLESELFGHVRGAFTGAVKDRPGKFEAASGGTIFLDEIGTASAALQVKLLRVLQDRVIERVGDSTPIEVDTRLVLATNVDLDQEVAEGRFREDLYYRIHVVNIEIPPLRERRDDIPLLAELFRDRFAQENEKEVLGFEPEAMLALHRARLPGNVRQLENLVERAVVLCQGPRITSDDLPPALHAGTGASAGQAAGGDHSLVEPDVHLLPLKDALAGPERLILERALAAHDGNRQATARSLDINRSTLFNKMRKYGLL